MQELSFDKDKLIEKYKPDFAFAYGSGVFKQEGYTEKDKPVIDLVFAVNSTFDWHKNNLQENPRDYSFFARALGEKLIEKLQKKRAGVYYNSYVDFEEQTIKYGVISIKDLIKDLEEWNSLYVAGRLHKPVTILKSDEKIDSSIRKNLEYALNVSLLLLPEHFSEKELYETIAGISYLGDSRMKFENPKKVENIVSKNFSEFQKMYRRILSSNEKISFSNEKLRQDKDVLIQEEIYTKLPRNLKSILKSPIFFKANEEFQNNLREAISKIVYSSSISQTLKGLVSTGFFNSVRYVREKLKKAKAGKRGIYK